MPGQKISPISLVINKENLGELNPGFRMLVSMYYRQLA